MNYTIKLLHIRLVRCISIYVILFCVIVSKNATSQIIQYKQPFYNITTEQGLPSLETYSVKQDTKGYIWICTDAGVCRYDGFEYKTFTTKDGLTDNVVFDTYEDFKGRIWFITYNSLLCYYEKGQIFEYKYNSKIRKLVERKFSNQKEMWIDSNENLYYEIYISGIVKISKNGVLNQLHPVVNENVIHKVNGNSVLTYLYIEKYKIPNDTLYAINPKGDKVIIDFNNIPSHFSFPKGIENLNNNY